MTTLRERSHVLLWTLLFFFVASMAIGGLVGGANIMDLIFGGRNIQINAGRIGNKNITHRAYQFELNRQLNRMRDQGQEIDNRARQNAGDFAWNSLIDRVLKDEKIKSLGLEASLEEIYDFLLYTPPVGFQTGLMNAGYFANSDGKFDLNSYQEVVQNGALPAELEPLLNGWEIGARTFLADRKLQTLYNQLGSVNEADVLRKYMKDNLSCTIDYIYLSISSVEDSVIEISNAQIMERYNETKDDNYKTKDIRKTEYALFKPQPATNVKIGNVYLYKDTFENVSKQDKALQEALLFVDEAEYSSFSEAVSMFGVEGVDTLDIHETFEANSGIPFQMGVLRPAVRFAFDNSIGSISDPITAQNGIVVFHSISEKSGDYKPLDDVKESIRRTLTREHKKDYAKTLLKPTLNNTNKWAAMADADPLLQYSSGETGKVGGSFSGIGKSNELMGTLLAMEAGEISGVIETFNAVLVLHMTNKDALDNAKYLDNYTTIRDNLLNTERSRSYTSWLTDARKAIKKEDYRSEVY